MDTLLLISCFADGPFVWKSPAGIVEGLLKLAWIAIREEVIFRGIIANVFGAHFAKDYKGLWKAVILSGLIFGAAHLTNVLAGIPLQPVLVQSFVAFVFGMYLTAVYFRGGNLWALILMHAITDASGLFMELFTEGVVENSAIASLSLANLLPVVWGMLLLLMVMRPSVAEDGVVFCEKHRRAKASPSKEKETALLEN